MKGFMETMTRGLRFKSGEGMEREFTEWETILAKYITVETLVPK